MTATELFLPVSAVQILVKKCPLPVDIFVDSRINGCEIQGQGHSGFLGTSLSAFSNIRLPTRTTQD